MKIKIKLLHPSAKIPTRGSPFSAGYDLYATEAYTLLPGERYLFKTGIATAMPNGVFGRIAPRSGLALKQGIDVMAGIIDSDYRNEIGVVLINLGQLPVKFPIIKDGVETAIAQIIFENHNEAEFEKTEVLPESKRGMGGFGHSDLHKQLHVPEVSNIVKEYTKHGGSIGHIKTYEEQVKEIIN